MEHGVWSIERRFAERHLTFAYILTPLNVFSKPNVHSVDGDAGGDDDGDDDDDAHRFELLL